MNQDRPVLGLGVTDDDFFHLTCHIDDILKQKIEKGEFVDLDRLLPKDRTQLLKQENESRYEWVRTDGIPFFGTSQERE